MITNLHSTEFNFSLNILNIYVDQINRKIKFL